MLKKIFGLIFPGRSGRKSLRTTGQNENVLNEARPGREEQKEQESIFEDFSGAELEETIDAAGNKGERLRHKNLIQVRYNLPYEESLGNTGFLEEDRNKIKTIKRIIIKRGYRPSREWCGYYRCECNHCVIRFLVREKVVFLKVYAGDFSYGESDTIGPPFPAVNKFLEFLECNGA